MVGEGAAAAELVTLERVGATCVISLNRPRVRNAQNFALLYALDRAFAEFAADDSLRVAVLGGAGPSFSAGHDMGTDGIDYDVSYPRVATLWWDHVGKEGAEDWMAREEEMYLALCRRWREIPKPTIAMVQGACISGGLMIAWTCDLIVAAEDAVFADPVVAMGIPGVELFAHPWELGARQAKELLFTGDRLTAQRAYELGMVNRVVPLAELREETLALAERIAQMPAFGLALAKRAVNTVQDAMGYRAGTESVFGLHQLAQLHNLLTVGAPGRGATAQSLKQNMDNGG